MCGLQQSAFNFYSRDHGLALVLLDSGRIAGLSLQVELRLFHVSSLLGPIVTWRMFFYGNVGRLRVLSGNK